MIDRRSFLRLGLAAIAAPAVIRVAQIMPIKALPMDVSWEITNDIRLWPEFETQRQIVNANIHSNWQIFSDGLADLEIAETDFDTGPLRFRARARADRNAHLWYGTHGQ